MEGLKETMATLGFFVGISALIIWFLFWLFSRKNPVLGILLIVIVAVACISCSGWMYYETTGYDDVKLQAKMADGYKGEATLRLDRDDNVVGASAVKIKDKGNRVMEVTWLSFCYDVAEPEFYVKYIKEMVKDYDVDKNTPDLMEESKTFYQSGGTAINRNIGFLLLALIDGPLLAIYLLKRRQMKKKRQEEELAKMKINML